MSASFCESLGEALLIVLAVSFLSLGWRAGLVVALTIPLVLAATFCGHVAVMGIDLQRISLGALIIALGLLVDDAMIAVEMMERKLEEGFDKLSAATFAYTSTAFPMLTGTLITVAGFIPVGFATSTAGEYVSTLFWVVGISLIISWFAAVYFTPWIGYRLLKTAPACDAEQPGEPSTAVLPRLTAAVGWCVRRRRAGGGADAGRVRRQHRRLRLHSAAVLPRLQPAGNPGRPLAARRHLLQGRPKPAAKAVEKMLAADSRRACVTTFIGEGAPRFYLPLDQQLHNPNFAQLLRHAEDRSRRATADRNAAPHIA